MDVVVWSTASPTSKICCCAIWTCRPCPVPSCTSTARTTKSSSPSGTRSVRKRRRHRPAELVWLFFFLFVSFLATLFRPTGSRQQIRQRFQRRYGRHELAAEAQMSSSWRAGPVQLVTECSWDCVWIAEYWIYTRVEGMILRSWSIHFHPWNILCSVSLPVGTADGSEVFWVGLDQLNVLSLEMWTSLVELARSLILLSESFVKKTKRGRGRSPFVYLPIKASHLDTLIREEYQLCQPTLVDGFFFNVEYLGVSTRTAAQVHENDNICRSAATSMANQRFSGPFQGRWRFFSKVNRQSNAVLFLNDRSVALATGQPVFADNLHAFHGDHVHRNDTNLDVARRFVPCASAFSSTVPLWW